MAKRKKPAKGRDKRDRRKRRTGELPPWLTASVIHQEKRHGRGRRKRD